MPLNERTDTFSSLSLSNRQDRVFRAFLVMDPDAKYCGSVRETVVSYINPLNFICSLIGTPRT